VFPFPARLSAVSASPRLSATSPPRPTQAASPPPPPPPPPLPPSVLAAVSPTPAQLAADASLPEDMVAATFAAPLPPTPARRDVLITGATGFLGSHLLAALCNAWPVVSAPAPASVQAAEAARRRTGGTIPAFTPVTEEMLAAAGPPVFVCLIRPTAGAVGGGTTAIATDDDGLLEHRLPANVHRLRSGAHCFARRFVGSAHTVRAEMGACGEAEPGSPLGLACMVFSR